MNVDFGGCFTDLLLMFKGLSEVTMIDKRWFSRHWKKTESVGVEGKQKGNEWGALQGHCKLSNKLKV